MTFDETPFADALFAKVCWNHGCLDGGRGWQHQLGFPIRQGGLEIDWGGIGQAGIGNDAIWGVPQDLPAFRYGHHEDEAFLSISLDGASYVRRGDTRTVHVEGDLPDTVLAAAAGRALRDLADLPGIGDDIMASAQRESVGGRREIAIRLRDASMPSEASR